MNKYDRYFKITEGVLIEEVKKCLALNKQADADYVEILDKLGADRTYYVRCSKLVAMTFPETPDEKVFKRNKNVKNGWYPKKNCKAGKDIAKALEAVKTKDIQDCLKAVSLAPGPRIIDGGYGYSATLVVIPSDPMVAFVRVPWFDEAPEELENYKKERAAGIRVSMTMDALLWEPTPEMEEVKERVVKKAIQEWNDSLKDEAAA